MRNKNLNQIIYPNKDQIKSFIYRASDNSQDDVWANLSILLLI